MCFFAPQCPRVKNILLWFVQVGAPFLFGVIGPHVFHFFCTAIFYHCFLWHKGVIMFNPRMHGCRVRSYLFSF